VKIEDLKYDHLVGNPMIFGTQDCLSLFRNFYDVNFGIKIRNYARPEGWSSDKLDLMRLCYEREGFEMITDWKPKTLRPADVLCMAIGESNPNHFSINIGDGDILHHLYGRLSSKEEFRDFWRNSTCYVLRHPDVPDMRPVYPDVTIAELLNARNLPPTG
jgi:cell wall-associated NlpC family hydrolase